jgi:phosphoribosylformylglycinamidine cyclo-ligase
VRRRERGRAERRASEAPGLTYATAGVDIAAGEKAVEMIKEHVRSTFRPEVVGDIGGFGGLFSLGKLRYRDPLLVSSTDGVGTKSVIAAQVGVFDTIGIDVVAMWVDDNAAHGAEPRFFHD